MAHWWPKDRLPCCSVPRQHQTTVPVDKVSTAGFSQESSLRPNRQPLGQAVFPGTCDETRALSGLKSPESQPA